MSFFDSKQETLNIELTSYGKLLLSRGKFKPVYYAFFDDDVVYDSSYIDISESQNDTQQRIMNETPISKPQYKFVGGDKTVNQNSSFFNEYNLISNDLLKENVLLKLFEQQNLSEKKYALSFPIGKNSFNSEYYPAWQINMLSGTITSSAPYIDNSDGVTNTLQPFDKIPQINLTNAIQDVTKTPNSMFVSPKDGYENIGFIINADNEIINIDIKLEQYLLEILEKNVDDTKENFDIEVFIEENYNFIPVLRQLSFIKQPVEIKNNILLDKPEMPENTEDLYKNPNFVEHYLKILIDDEIILPPKQKIKVGAYESNISPDVVGGDC